MRNNKWLAALCAALLLLTLVSCKPKDEKPKLGYATEGVTVVEDPDALQKAVDEMERKAKEPGIALEYKNDAKSDDGKTFECYVANSLNNEYDMFLNIYADAELTDQIFLSELLRPGAAFESITLDEGKSLDKGTHTVYVAFTQVEEDLETIHSQIIVTMNFTVS